MASKGKHKFKARKKCSSSCKVFVGNISYRIDEAQLSEFFSSEFGPVLSAEIIRDHRKGWSRGIGFVTFYSVESAELALAALPEQLILDERTMRINVPSVPKRRQGGKKLSRQLMSSDEGSEDLMGASKHSQPLQDGNNHFRLDESRNILLNDDVLFVIFQFLPLKDRIRAERVCKQWQRVARCWWKSVKVLNFEGVFVSFQGLHAALTDSILNSVLSRGCRELQSLDVSSSPCQLSDYALHLISMYCSKLEYLNISRVAVTPQSLKKLSQCCNALKTLIIRGCHSIGEKSLWWALHHCRSLQVLDISQNRRVNGQCFYMASPILRTVILSDCDSVTDDGISLLTRNCPVLSCLNINKCNRLTGAALQALTKVR